YDPRTTVALLQEPKEKPANSITSVNGDLQLKWEKYTPNYRSAHVTVPQDGFLRISEVYYPGWEIRIDKKPVSVYRADLAFMAVTITKGDHEIEMLPHSLYLKKAQMISFPLIALMFLYWIGVLIFRKKKTLSVAKS
ncbi:MAG TPA: YfhO family protein, partial [Chitinivibrionales bacterium]